MFCQWTYVLELLLDCAGARKLKALIIEGFRFWKRFWFPCLHNLGRKFGNEIFTNSTGKFRVVSNILCVWLWKLSSLPVNLWYFSGPEVHVCVHVHTEVVSACALWNFIVEHMHIMFMVLFHNLTSLKTEKIDCMVLRENI